MKYHVLAWIPVILWCGLIFFMSSLPTVPTPFAPWWDVLLKKSAHVIEYAVLSFLTLRALSLSVHRPKWRLLFWRPLIPATQLRRFVAVTVIFCLLYAFSDEWHQSFTPGRHPSFWDVLVDAGGISLGIYVTHKYLRDLDKI